jgi:hypothetical protein
MKYTSREIEISRFGPTPDVRAAVFGVQSPKLNYQFPARRQIIPRRSVMLRESFSPPPAPRRRLLLFSLSLFSLSAVRDAGRPQKTKREMREEDTARRGGNSAAAFRPEQPSQVKARTKAPSQKKTFPRRPPAVVRGKKYTMQQQCDQEGILRKYKFLFEWQAGVFRLGCATPDNKKHTTGPKALAAAVMKEAFCCGALPMKNWRAIPLVNPPLCRWNLHKQPSHPARKVIASQHLTLGQQKWSGGVNALIICMHSDRKLGGCGVGDTLCGRILFEIND